MLDINQSVGGSIARDPERGFKKEKKIQGLGQSDQTCQESCCTTACDVAPAGPTRAGYSELANAQLAAVTQRLRENGERENKRIEEVLLNAFIDAREVGQREGRQDAQQDIRELKARNQEWMGVVTSLQNQLDIADSYAKNLEKGYQRRGDEILILQDELRNAVARASLPAKIEMCDARIANENQSLRGALNASESKVRAYMSETERLSKQIQTTRKDFGIVVVDSTRRMVKRSVQHHDDGSVTVTLT